MDKPQKKEIDQDPADYARHVQAQIVVKSWSEIEVHEQEASNFLVFKEAIYRRKADGSWETVDCMLHPLRGAEKRTARRNAHAMAAAEKISEERDADLYSDIDTLCILQLAIRNTTPPYEPLYGSPAELEKAFDRECLAHVFGVLDQYAKLLDPRLEVLDKVQFNTVVAAIVAGRSIRPLLAFGGAAQVSFIITMADLLHSLASGKFSPELFELSTPERSPTATS
jgi:hypothetical protein